MHKRSRFPATPLKPSQTLRWVIWGVISMPYCQPALAADVVPLPGGAQLTAGSGVPVLNIVAPNAAGVSHNQFFDYNVQRPGLVLNNALAAGNSQLAGQLGANPQFRGQDARLILNEVVSRNPSNILGPQEIFGRAADYVLANPNGINVNGASFINTPRASLVVGRPELDNGALARLNTFDTTNALTVGEQGVTNSAGAIALIAPRVHTQGTVKSRDDLNVLIGHNQLRYTDDSLQSTAQPTAPAVDAQLLGAMQGGRINIISTTDGAGVKIAAPLTARGDLKVSSEGNLHIDGKPEPQRLLISSTSGDVALKARGDVQVSAAKVRGRNIDANAGRNLRLDAKSRDSTQQKNENWSKKAWFITTETYDKNTTKTQTEHFGSDLTASADMTLKAGADLLLEASSASAGGTLKAEAGENMRLTARNDSLTTREVLKHRKNLWRGDYDSSKKTETVRGSSLASGGAMKLNTGKDLQALGSQVQSGGDLAIESGGQLNIGTTRAVSENTQKNYEGDLLDGALFGKNGKDNRSEDLAIGSRVNAKGKLSISSENVLISGSQVIGEQDAVLISKSGVLNIDGAQSLLHSDKATTDSKVFGLLKDHTSEQKDASNLVRSQVQSKSNLRLQSASDVTVTGADVEAGGRLEVDAVGDVNLLAGTSSERTVTETDRHDFSFSSGETKPEAAGIKGSKQYQAGINYTQEQNTTTNDTLTHEGSQLKGATVDINAGNTVRVKGSDVTSTEGDSNLAGKSIELLSEADTTSRVSQNDSLDLGYSATGGLDRAGGGYAVSSEKVTQTQDTSTVKSSRLNSAGDLNLIADGGQGKLVSEAAKAKAAGNLTIKAGAVDNRAVSDSKVETKHVKRWSAGIGADVEYKDLTRPVQKLIEGTDQSKVYQPSVLDALDTPNLGINLAVNVLDSRAESGTTKAVVSEFEGASVKVQVGGALNDTGTRYVATDGAVSIDAGSHTLAAAEDTTWQRNTGTDVDTSLRLYSTTGSDLSARLLGAGGSFDLGQATRTAVPGSLEGKNGIAVQLGTDGRYEGSRLHGGQGDLKIHAGGSLVFSEARDRQTSSESTLSGAGWLEAGTSPSTGKKGGAGFQLDKAGLSVEDTQGRGASVFAEGKTLISAEQDLLMQGADIGAPDAGDVHLKAGKQLEFLAGVDTHTASGNSVGGGARLSLKATQSDAASTSGGGLGAQLSVGTVDERSNIQRGGRLESAGSVRIEGANVRLQGAQGQAKEFLLAANGGDLILESAVSHVQRNNSAVSAGLGISATRGTDTAENASGLFARAKGGIDKLDSLTHDNTRLKADRVRLDSSGDTRLLGASVSARDVAGQIGGDLRVESRQDQVQGLKVQVDAQLTTEKSAAGAVDKASVAGGPLSGKLKNASKKLYERSADKARSLKDKLMAKTGSTPSTNAAVAAAAAAPSFLKDKLFQKSGGRDITPTLLADVSHFSNNTVAQASGIDGRNGVDLDVGGAVNLSGARIGSGNGAVALGGAKVTANDVTGRDQRTDFSINASNSPEQLGKAVHKQLTESGDPQRQQDEQFNLGLLRGGGHDRSQLLSSGIDQKTP